MTDLLRLDAMALALIGHDVAMVPDDALDKQTPCEGWAITDLLQHMNERHETIAQTVLGPSDAHSDDLRADFAYIAARWVTALEQAGEHVNIPSRGETSTEWVLGVHVVDMLAHRWDLARALGRSLDVPKRLTAAALPLARANTAPGSPLNGPDGAYLPPRSEDTARSDLDVIVALLGRDPQWSAGAE